MLVRSLVWGMGIGGTLTVAAFLLVLIYFDPQATGGVGLTLFFVSLAASLLVWLTLLVYFLHRRKIGTRVGDLFTEEDDASIFLLSLRQGGEISLILIGFLILQSFRLTSWWNILLLLLVPVVVETYARIKVE